MKFDAIIIGFGKAGKTLAGFLAKKGEKVALIERSEKMYGGTCINIGCIPTKTLVHSAHLARRDGSWKEKQEYFRAAMEQKDAVVSFLREKNYEKLDDDPNVTIFLGVGSFAGKNAVEVRGKDLAVTLEAPKIFINTGSETVIPDLPGVTGNPRVFTSTTLLDLKELPQRLTIVGGGYIGLEFASMFASFGTQVTVLEKGPQVLPREDRDIAAAVQGILEKKGVQFKTHVNVTQIDGGPWSMKTVPPKKKFGWKGTRCFWRLAAVRTLKRWHLKKRALKSMRAEPSWSTNTCAPPTRRSTPWATSRAGRFSPISP